MSRIASVSCAEGRFWLLLKMTVFGALDEGGREGGMEGGREGGREREREGRREGGKERIIIIITILPIAERKGRREGMARDNERQRQTLTLIIERGQIHSRASALTRSLLREGGGNGEVSVIW